VSSGVGVLARDFQVRVINVSESGCLFESPRLIEVGLVGRLWLRFGLEEYDDDIHVVRCHAIEGAGTVYYVGLRFMWSRRLAGSIRQAVANHLATEITGARARVM
jgi:hypothetical protein